MMSPVQRAILERYDQVEAQDQKEGADQMNFAKQIAQQQADVAKERSKQRTNRLHNLTQSLVATEEDDSDASEIELVSPAPPKRKSVRKTNKETSKTPLRMTTAEKAAAKKRAKTAMTPNN